MKWSRTFVKRSSDALVRTHLNSAAVLSTATLCSMGRRLQVASFLPLTSALRRADRHSRAGALCRPGALRSHFGQTWCDPRAMGQGACCSTNHSIIHGCLTPQCCTTFCPCQSSRLLRFIALSWTLPPSLVRTHLTWRTSELYLSLTMLVFLPYVLHSP